MPDPQKNPLSQPVGPIVARTLQEITEKHRIHDRTGGRKHLEPAIKRLAIVDPKLETHVDEHALDAAADSVAVAVHYLERTKQEHSDANRNELAIDRARALLAEALLLLECAHAVNYHADAIAKVRTDAVDKANAPPSPR